MSNQPQATRPERILTTLIAAALLCAALMSLAGIFLLTLGFDEAWILLALHQIIHPATPDMAIAPVVSNGGLFAAAQLAISAVVGNALWAHRLFVFLCLIAIAAILMRQARRQSQSTAIALLVPSVLIGLPGTLVFGATAYGTMPAFLLLLCVIEVWDATSERRWTRRIACGIVAGLAAATRLELLMLLPAMVIAALLQREGRRARLTDALIAAVIGAAILGASLALLYHAAPAKAPVDSTSVGSMTGATGAILDYPRLLNKWVIGESFMSPALLVLATLVGWVIMRGSDRRSTAVASILIPCGWLLWLAWLARSPIPHLRYLWPALACFAVVLGFGLAHLYEWGQSQRQPFARIAALTLGLACILSGLGSTLRDLVHGEGNILSWEWSRETPADYYRRFQYVHDQRAAAQYLRDQTTPNEDIGVVGLDMELRYLTGRRIIPLQSLAQGDAWKDPAHLPRRFMISPMVGSYLYLRPQGYRWIEENCTLEAQFGRYSFYRVTGPYPPDPATLTLDAVRQPPHPLSKRTWGG
jgi:hypothetical protein